MVTHILTHLLPTIAAIKMMSEYWIISAPGDKTCQQTYDTMNNLTSKQHNLCNNYKFHIPDLKVRSPIGHHETASCVGLRYMSEEDVRVPPTNDSIMTRWAPWISWWVSPMIWASWTLTWSRSPARWPTTWARCWRISGASCSRT